MTTGERIKAARKKAGMTQAELAEKLEIPFQSVSQWERDIRNPKKETLEKIAEKIGFSDATYFARVFKKLEKMTPQQYRNKKK